MSEDQVGQPFDLLRIESTAPRLSGSSHNDSGGVYTWHWHIKSNSLYWCADHPGRDCFRGIDAFLQLVDAQDRDSVRQIMKAAAVSGAPSTRDITLHFATGNTLDVQLKTLPICDRSGQVVSVLGLCYAGSSPVEELSSTQCALLAQAEEIAKFGTWRFDAQSRQATLSPHLARMLGTAPETRLSEEQYWKKIHPGDRTAVIENVTRAIAAGAPFEYTARYFSPMGGTRHHFVRGLPNLNRNGRLRSVIGITFDFSDQNHVEGELHRLSQRLLRTRDEERRIVARELHESTGQTLAAVKMSLGRLREALPQGDAQLHGLLQSAVELAENAIREVRTLSYLMHPPMLDEAGLRSAVHWYAKGFTERSGIPIQVLIPEGFGRYGQEVETTIFRIVQEALTNIHRHSGSRTASICLEAENGCISAVIQDDGCGLPSLGLSREHPLGVGIVGMRERVKQLNGRFEIYSAPGKGTTIRATLPLVQTSGALTQTRQPASRRTRSPRN